MSPITVRLDIRSLKKSLMWEDEDGLHADMLLVHNEGGSIGEHGSTHVLVQVPQADQRKTETRHPVGFGRLLRKEFTIPDEPQRPETKTYPPQWEIDQPLPFES